MRLLLARPVSRFRLLLFKYLTCTGYAFFLIQFLAWTSFLLGLVLLVAQPCPEHTWLNAVVQPIVVLGMLVNDRRIAFVGIAGGIAALVLLSPPALQRKLKRASLLLAPVIAATATTAAPSEQVRPAEVPAQSSPSGRASR